MENSAMSKLTPLELASSGAVVVATLAAAVYLSRPELPLTLAARSSMAIVLPAPVPEGTPRETAAGAAADDLSTVCRSIAACSPEGS
jgi:hypothetical protein